MKKKYEWTRFFCKSNEDPVLVEDAYLYDPKEGEGFVNTHVKPLKDIESIPCLVILGEPGMGKSIALEDEKERLSQISNSDTLPPVMKKMEEFREGGDLRRVIFESQEWLRWKQGDEKITLLLDSLDEVRINIDTVCSILTEEFKDVDKNRLSLKICCRSGHWPDNFGEELRKLWGEGQVAIFKILPLRTCDVEKAVQETGDMDSSRFMSEVKNKGVQTFAAKPITLMPLIEEFSSEKSLPGTQWEIYEKLCLKLCDEPNPRYKETPSLKQSYNLDKNQRMGVASKIAAVMILCRHKLVNLEERSDNSSEDVLFFEDMSTAEEKNGSIRKTDFEETVGKTSIFHFRGNHSYIFGHQTYMEFLAAKYLCDVCNLPFRTLRKILSTQVSGIQKVTPQLRELAAWCSNRERKLKKWMIRNDPIALIYSDLSVLTYQEKYSLVENLLSELDRLEYFDTSLIWAHGRKLKHSNLGKQLKGYIEDIGKSTHVREVAIDIARKCRVEDLSDLLLEIITNDNEYERLRSHACYAFEKVGSQEQKKKLRAVLFGEEEIGDGLKGSLLSILWPDFISIDELLDVLIPAKDPDTIGTYCDMFIYDLENTIKAIDIPHVLKHFRSFKVTKSIPSYSIERLLDKLFMRSLNNLDSHEAKRDIAEYMLARHYNDQDIVKHDAEKKFRDVIRSNVDVRRDLISELVEIDLPANIQEWLVGSCIRQCADFDDFFWIIDSVDNRSARAKIFLMNLAYGFIVQYEGLPITSEHVTSFLAKLEECEDEVKEKYIFLSGVNLDSEEAKRQRKWALKRKEQKKEQERIQQAQPKPEDILNQSLFKAMSGELNAWVNLCIAICSEGERITNDFIRKHFFSESLRWRHLDETIKSSVNEAALQFLLNNPPVDHRWLSTNSRSRYIGSGQIALSLIAYPSDRIDMLPIDILKAWIPTVIGFWGTPDEGFKRVIEHTYEKCPEKFIEYLNIRVDFDNENNFSSHVIDYMEGVFDQRLQIFLFDKIKEKKCKPRPFERFCNLLRKSPSDEFVEYIASKICAPWPATEAEKEISSKAFEVLLCNWSLRFWEVIKTCFSEAPDLCLKALYDLSYDHQNGRADPLSNLGTQQLAELYIWLRNYKYKRDGNSSTRRGSMEDYSYLEIDNYIINRLVITPTPDSIKALKYIQKHLVDENKKYFKYHLNRAKEEEQRAYCRECTPKDVIEFENSGKKQKFILKLSVLVIILCVSTFIYYSILQYETVEEIITKLHIGYWTPLFVTNIIFICFWYYLFLAEDEKYLLQKIKSKIYGWKS